ncbi:MAG TPA: glycosyltransferase, partial [Candidatus Merdenecus merdavium]|nr:glycosyltransferase [Candidatus Merdenecus merdavium]
MEGKGYLRKFIKMLQVYGFSYTVKKTSTRIKRILKRFFGYEQDYEKWRLKRMPLKQELEEQKKRVFTENILFSIVVPLYKTESMYLEALINSIKAQTYSNWELCLSDGSGPDSPLKEQLELLKKDKRIKVVDAKKRLHISENTNEALKIAKGDFIVFVDHDDLLSPDALFECAKAYEEDPRIEIIYSDEDKISMDGKSFFQPHFKSDFNIDLLRSMNYISHLSVIKRNLLHQVGYLNEAFDGAQDYDLILRCVEKTNHIYHIPKVLYHWRAHINSTAEKPESKAYAFQAGAKAIQAHYRRLGIKATVQQGEYPGLYQTKYEITGEPFISIIIPNKDHIEDLDQCLASIETRSTYKNYEYIIVENNSTEESTFQYYEQLKRRNKKVRVINYHGEFNYSSINNFGASHAKGEYYLLLNNDTEMINDDCIEELLGVCQREDVGIVGARLYYEDDTIQHAGVIVGLGGVAGHTFVGYGKEENG